MLKWRRSARVTIGAFFACAACAASALEAPSKCPNGLEVALINGRIHTMDASNSVVSAVTIRNGKFVSVGPAAGAAAEAGCKKVSHLRGRVALPRLLCSHTHSLRVG